MKPGRVAFVALLAMWCAVGAQSPARSVNWARARAETAKFRTTIDTSGLTEVDGFIAPNVDAEDLQALCAARRAAIVGARASGTAGLREQPAGRDPITDERRSDFYRLLGSVASFEGDMAQARLQFEAGRDALAPYVSEYKDLGAKHAVMAQAAAVAALRQGEIENCLVMPSADRCIVPLRPGGVHHHTAGAKAAFEQLTPLAAANSSNLELRWLLNLSAMVQGRYPDLVPREARLPADLFKSETPLPRFIDVATQAGVAKMETAGGTITDDFDNDGLLDIVFTSVDFCTPMRLYRNRGDGTFEDRTEAAGLSRQLGGLNATQTDYDNDGWLDLFIHRGGWEIPMRNSLLHNNRDGTFTDVTRAAGLSSPSHSTHSAVWTDYDNDGWLDVFVAHELSPSQLFRNRHDGTFEDVAARAGVGATAFTKGVTAGDYDNDGYPDLYLSNMFGDNVLYHNNRDGTFTNVAPALGVVKPFASFPTWFFDADNDGWLDIFVASYPNSVEEFLKHYLGQPLQADPIAFYRNNGDGTFTDATARAGLARVVPSMGANFGDLDNDGFLDMYLGTGAPSFASLMPNVMLRNDGGRRFVDVTEATGTGHLQKGHGIGFADLDNDGDEDVVLNTGGAVPGDRYDDALFENPGTPGNRWLLVKLVGTKSNRAGVGARLRVTVREGGRTTLRAREVTSGGSFGSNSLMQHIGLGRASRIESLEVFWPASGIRQTFRDVPLDTAIDVREDASTFTVRQLHKFRLGK